MTSEILPIFFTIVFDGIVMGGIYGLMALGLALVLGVMYIWNFAHGQFLLLSGYIVLWLFTTSGGLNPFFTSPVPILALMAIGLFTYRFLINPFTKFGIRQYIVTSVYVCLGLGIVLESFMLLTWGTRYRGIPFSIEPASIMGFSTMRIIGLIVALSVLIFLHIALTKTYFGKALRAIIQDREAAASLGINVDGISLLTFGISAALAGAAGLIFSIIYYVNPVIGMSLTFKSFVIVMLGGLGTVMGILVAAFILGLAEALVGYFISTAYIDTISLLVLIFALGLGISKVK